MISKLIGIGSYVPAYKLTNAKLEELVETNDEWIVQRTGIRERRIAVGQTTKEIATAAAQAALQDAGLTGDQIDLVVVSTVSPDCFTPSVSCMVQAGIGAKNAAAFDINAACSGFVYGVDIADSYIRSGKYQRVLVVAAEVLSRFVDYTDRTTCVLFGDGAGAAVFEASEGDRGILSTFLAADGTNGECLWAEAMPHDETPFGDRKPLTMQDRALRMDGKTVFRFTASAVPEAIDRVLSRANIGAEQVDWFVLHQANQRILQMVTRRYGLEQEKVYVNIDRFGNTSSASIPLCLAEMKEKGLLHEGQTAVFCGFGGGLTYGAILVRI